MADVDTVRVYIADTPVYAKEEIGVNGVQTSLQLYYSPAIQSTVIITGSAIPDYTFDEQNGVIRFVSSPATQVLTVEYSHVSLLDAQIQLFIDAQADQNTTPDLRLPAADALDAIARSQALIQKKIKLLDLETDGPALAAELRKSADALRKQVYSVDFQESTFDIAEQIDFNDGPAFTEKIRKDWMREGLT